MSFKRAVRSKAKIKIAITGPSGAGKTYSSLLLAKGMGSKIALIDTENGSASLYADKDGMPEYDVLEVGPPYTVDKYRRAIREAVAAGYDVLIIDSLSHVWAGDGGLLHQKEQKDAAGKGNSYTNWASITKDHEALKGEILNANIHLIATMRSKQDYILGENSKGKQEPKKVGMAPIQRDGMEYEFTTVFDIAMTHEAFISKDRTALFDGESFPITEIIGRRIMEWLNGAVEPEISIMLIDVSKSDYIMQVISHVDHAIKLKVIESDYLDKCLAYFKKDTVTKLSYEESVKIINNIEQKLRNNIMSTMDAETT